MGVTSQFYYIIIAQKYKFEKQDWSKLSVMDKNSITEMVITLVEPWISHILGCGTPSLGSRSSSSPPPPSPPP